MSLNKVMLIGNVGRDPEVRHLESGVVTASFTLATTERYKDRNGEQKEQTEWHNIVCWRSLAEIAEKYVRKGSSLYVEGKIRNRSYNDKEGNTKYITEILADSFQLLGRKSDAPAAPIASPTSSYSAPTQHTAPSSRPLTTSEPDTGAVSPEEGDDLPF